MPPETGLVDSIVKLLVGSTGAVAALVLGIRWLNKDRDGLVTALNEEREARILVLEEAAKRCAEDRMAMHREMAALQAEVRELYRRIASIVSGHGDEDVSGHAVPLSKTTKVRLTAPLQHSES